VTSDLGALTYLLSSPFNAAFEFEINPFDAEISVPWTIVGEAVVSPKTPARPRFVNAVTRRNFLSFADLGSDAMAARGVASVVQVSTAPLRLVTEQDRSVQIAATIAVPTIESEAQLKALLTSLSGVDAVGADARAAKLSTRSIKKSTKLAAIEMAISMVDLTTLEAPTRQVE